MGRYLTCRKCDGFLDGMSLSHRNPSCYDLSRIFLTFCDSPRGISMVHIGLVFDYSTSYCRGVLRGIKQYAEARQNWVLMPVVSDARAIRMLAKMKPEGVITWVFRKALIEILASLRVPWVGVCGVLPDLGVPRVVADDILIGQMAATHLLDRGIRHFGFIGHADHAGPQPVAKRASGAP